MSNDNFFDKLLYIFSNVFGDVEKEIFTAAANMYLSGIITAFLTLIIIFYAVRKIREGTFEFPKDVYNIIIFLIMVVFVNYSLKNQGFTSNLTSYLDIPSNLLGNIIKSSRAFNIGGNQSIGAVLNDMVIDIADRAYLFTGGDSVSLFKLSLQSIFGFLGWLVYAWFGFTLIVSISVTFLLNYLQIEFWKSFAIVMIPLIYFKVTRGMVIHWGKTIIALSLISTFMVVVGHLSSSVEQSLIQYIPNDENNKASTALLIALIIVKIISITFLKEIPPMINGMLGTQAAQGAGQFANSVAMGSVGAAGAAAGWGAFKGAMKGGQIAKGLGATGKDAFMAQGGAASKLLENGGGSAGGSGSSIGGNVKRTIAGLRNISQGKSAYNKSESPKTPPKEN